MKSLIFTTMLGVLALQAPAAEPSNPPQGAPQRLHSESMATTEDMSNVLEATDQQVQTILAELSTHLNESKRHGAAMGELKHRVTVAANAYIASPTPESKANLTDSLAQFAAEGAQQAGLARDAEQAFNQKLGELKRLVGEDVARVTAEAKNVHQIGAKLRAQLVQLDSEIDNLAKRLEDYPLDDLPPELVDKLDEALIYRDQVASMNAVWKANESMMEAYQADIEGFASGLTMVERQSRRSILVLDGLQRNFEMTGVVVAGAAKWELLDGTYAQLGDMFRGYASSAAKLDGFARDMRQTGEMGLSSLGGDRTPRDPIVIPNAAEGNVRAFLEQRRRPNTDDAPRVSSAD